MMILVILVIVSICRFYAYYMPSFLCVLCASVVHFICFKGRAVCTIVYKQPCLGLDFWVQDQYSGCHCCCYDYRP